MLLNHLFLGAKVRGSGARYLSCWTHLSLKCLSRYKSDYVNRIYSLHHQATTAFLTPPPNLPIPTNALGSSPTKGSPWTGHDFSLVLNVVLYRLKPNPTPVCPVEPSRCLSYIPWLAHKERPKSPLFSPITDNYKEMLQGDPCTHLVIPPILLLYMSTPLPHCLVRPLTSNDYALYNSVFSALNSVWPKGHSLNISWIKTQPLN